MFYRKCTVYYATPISRCPCVRHFIWQKSIMQYAITLSKPDQERSTKNLGILYDAVGERSTCTVLSDPDEILLEKWSDSISSWPLVKFGDI